MYIFSHIQFKKSPCWIPRVLRLVVFMPFVIDTESVSISLSCSAKFLKFLSHCFIFTRDNRQPTFVLSDKMDSFKGRKQNLVRLAVHINLSSLSKCLSEWSANLFALGCRYQDLALIRVFLLRWMRAWHPPVWTWPGLLLASSVMDIQRPAKGSRTRGVSKLGG